MCLHLGILGLHLLDIMSLSHSSLYFAQNSLTMQGAKTPAFA